jgi:hypothetical protein
MTTQLSEGEITVLKAFAQGLINYGSVSNEYVIRQNACHLMSLASFSRQLSDLVFKLHPIVDSVHKAGMDAHKQEYYTSEQSHQSMMNELGEVKGTINTLVSEMNAAMRDIQKFAHDLRDERETLVITRAVESDPLFGAIS